MNFFSQSILDSRCAVKKPDWLKHEARDKAHVSFLFRDFFEFLSEVLVYTAVFQLFFSFIDCFLILSVELTYMAFEKCSFVPRKIVFFL